MYSLANIVHFQTYCHKCDSINVILAAAYNLHGRR